MTCGERLAAALRAVRENPCDAEAWQAALQAAQKAGYGLTAAAVGWDGVRRRWDVAGVEHDCGWLLRLVEGDGAHGCELERGEGSHASYLEPDLAPALGGAA